MIVSEVFVFCFHSVSIASGKLVIYELISKTCRISLDFVVGVIKKENVQ